MRAVVLGAGPAGLTAAEILRRYDPTMKITLVSSERSPPYAPLAMSHYFQTGDDKALFWKGRDVCKKLGLGFRSGVAVRSVRPERHRVELQDRTCLPYDRLLIATGARLFVPIPGHNWRHIYNFKSLCAASKLVRRIRETQHPEVVIVGAGFLGVEVSLLLSDLGAKVTVLEMTERVMLRSMDEATAAIVLEAMKQRGVDVRLETRAVRFNGRARIDNVELSTGEKLRADIYVAATGVKPNVEFLEGSGIDFDWGVRVDDRLHTNVADVYAAGDVAEPLDRPTQRHSVHAIFPNAVEQGRVAAHNMLGLDTVYQKAQQINCINHIGISVLAACASSEKSEVSLHPFPLVPRSQPYSPEVLSPRPLL